MFIRFILATIVLLITVGFASNAHATAPIDAMALIDRLQNAEDPNAEFDSMTETEQQAVVSALQPASVVETVEVSGDDNNLAMSSEDEECLTHTRDIAAYNTFGQKLWEYETSTYFCFDGSQFTRDPDFDTYSWVWYGWEFVGNTQQSESGGEGDWHHRDYAQGHFQLCLAFKGIGCVRHDYPWVRKNQWADGSWNSSTGT